MNKNITFTKFKRHCLDDCQDIAYPDESYFHEHAYRLYDTFCICRTLLSASPTKNVLSLGAGSGLIEAQLNKLLKANISVIDFQEMFELNEKHYNKYSFKCHPFDLSEKVKFGVSDKFDVILSCEVIEHIPISPSDHISSFIDNLSDNGYFVIATPNLARFTSYIKLMRGLPLLPAPELTFSPVHFENEGIHRREYVESEIISAFAKNHLKHIKTKYTFHNLSLNLKTLVLLPLGMVIPRLKPIMIIFAQKIGHGSLPI